MVFKVKEQIKQHPCMKNVNDNYQSDRITLNCKIKWRMCLHLNRDDYKYEWSLHTINQE